MQTLNESVPANPRARWRYLRDIGRILSLRRASISLGNGSDAQVIYDWFSQPHAVWPMFGNKTVGVQLLDLCAFESFDAYLAGINGKNSAAYYRRKALGKGYAFVEIDRNFYIDDIQQINLSLAERQGRRLHPMYFAAVTHYENLSGWKYFGVANLHGRLLAYLDLQVMNEVAVVRQLLGHGQYLNDGIMYLLLIEVARRVQEMRATRYLMYDMYFGTSSGLRLFKEKLGFKPYWVKWTLG